MIEELISKGKIKKANISEQMYKKEYDISKRDLETAKGTLRDGNEKWATIQAYYAIFHAVRALVYKAGYREESHFAMGQAFKELYIDNNKMNKEIYITLDRGMNLREMADYKEIYSAEAAENLIQRVEAAIKELEKYI